MEHLADSYDRQVDEVRDARPETADCGPDRYASNVDLCAQWKAADAAADSAWWAWASGVAGLLSFVGVLGALGFAYDANRIARKTAKAQLRPYISLQSVTGRFLNQVQPTGEDVIGINGNLINSGATYAIDVALGIEKVVVEPGQLPIWTADLPTSSMTVGPGITFSSGGLAIPRAEAGRQWRREIQIYFFVVVRYRDVFGEVHELKNCSEVIFNRDPEAVYRDQDDRLAIAFQYHPEIGRAT